MKDEVMTNIVSLLESDETFAEIVEKILREAERYLCTSHAAVLQVSTDGKLINTVISYAGEGELPLKINNIPKSKFLIGSDELKCCATGRCSEEEKYALEAFGVRSSVVVPIFINDSCAMYFAVFDVRNELCFDKVRMQFIRDVSRIIQSIAQKKVTNNSLLSSYEVLRDILSSIGSGIMVFDKHGDEIYFENDVARKTDEVRRTIQKCVKERVIRQDNAKKPENDEETETERPIEHYDPESGLWFEIKFSDLTWIDGSAVIVCTAVDITQKKKNQQKIEYQANNDFLTGLYNRMKCELDLRNIICDAVCSNQKGALMFIDLDDFKHINDGLGHQYGDILLKALSNSLRRIKGIEDSCYRMGGDEFIIIVKPEQYDRLEQIIEEVQAIFNKPWFLHSADYYCTMSMGVVRFPKDANTVTDLIKKADISLYEAKKGGKNRVEYYGGDGEDTASRRLDMEKNMRDATANSCEEFEVYYQPVIDISGEKERCSGVEALVRWNSGKMGMVGPGEFIPLAEYLGLINPIGDFVLRKACEKCKYWNDMGHPEYRINVNLSVVQLLQNDIVERIRTVLEETKMRPENLTLEVTESLAINDIGRMKKVLSKIKELGALIALDDFGTGYSSLSHIRELPIDIIKIDRCFVIDLGKDDYAETFVRMVAELADTIGVRMCVEGVEYDEQLQILKDMKKVQYIQGYYYDKPLTEEAFEKKYL